MCSLFFKESKSESITLYEVVEAALTDLFPHTFRDNMEEVYTISSSCVKHLGNGSMPLNARSDARTYEHTHDAQPLKITFTIYASR